MSWLFGPAARPADSTTFGYNIEKKDTVAQMHGIKDRMKTTTNKYIGELDKYKEVARFNKQLSKSYIANLDVMVDVSKILNMYVETIEFIKKQIERAEQALGKPLDANDLAYLSQLTKENINTLYTKFFEETNKLSQLFANNPEFRPELERVQKAQTEMRGTPELASNVTGKLGAILRNEQQGLPSPTAAALPSIGGKRGGTNKKKVVVKTKKLERPKKK